MHGGREPPEAVQQRERVSAAGLEGEGRDALRDVFRLVHTVSVS